ncbi:MAG: flagellar hook-length control protein FliK [Acidobacteriota bacterium]
MNTLKQTATNVLSSSSQAGTNVLNDLVSRMNAQTGGAMQEEQKAAFSKWLERHSNSTASADGLNQSARAAAMQVKVQAHPAARHQAEHAPTPHSENAGAKPHAPAQANRKAEQAPAKNGATKTASKAQTDSTAKTADADKAEKPEADQDEVAFSTPLGEGTAIVRELQPPADVQRGDPASMMAWLSGLTQSDSQLAQAQADAKEAGLGKSEGRNASSSSVAALQSLLAGRGEHTGMPAGLDANGRPGLDVGAWQASQTMAQLSLQSAMGGATGEVGTDPLAGLAAAQNAQLAQTSAFENAQGAKHVSETLNTPMASPQFADELAEKVSLFVKASAVDGPMTAELHLNPAEMGPINIKIAVDGQNAQVDFAAAALETRKAIEASMPMLSQALDEVGLSLTGGAVSAQTSQQQFAQSGRQSDGSPDRSIGRVGDRSSAGRGGGEEGDEPAMRAVNVARLSQRGGLDLYA